MDEKFIAKNILVPNNARCADVFFPITPLVSVCKFRLYNEKSRSWKRAALHTNPTKH
jgi:hypothetical protein